MKRFHKLIQKSFNKFKPDLKGKIVLTEAATGNYVCTPILAAMAGAEVFAIAKDSKYGTVAEINKQIQEIAKEFNLNSINIITNKDEAPLNKVDVVTNTGFVRPINKEFIEKLKPGCVIPLMWEPWEFRPSELDLEACRKKGIKVYGTNESDPRLNTFEYLGFIALYFLLEERRTPNSTSILIVGGRKFNNPVSKILKKNGYNVTQHTNPKHKLNTINKYDTIILTDHEWEIELLGNTKEAVIQEGNLTEEHLIIHICGKVSLKHKDQKLYKLIPEKPAGFGYMSFTADFIDPSAVFDLHTAGLKVAEGMLKANKMGLNDIEFKNYVEMNYPALSFKESIYW